MYFRPEFLEAGRREIEVTLESGKLVDRTSRMRTHGEFSDLFAQGSKRFIVEHKGLG